jgi:hypothetical protein
MGAELNPKRVIEGRMDIAEGRVQRPSAPASAPASVDFFRPRDRSKDAAGLAKALKRRGTRDATSTGEWSE